MSDNNWGHEPCPEGYHWMWCPNCGGSGCKVCEWEAGWCVEDEKSEDDDAKN